MNKKVKLALKILALQFFRIDNFFGSGLKSLTLPSLEWIPENIYFVGN